MEMAATGTDWSSLPGDLIEEVAGRLSSDADHTHIHQVCTNWRKLTPVPAFSRPLVIALRPDWIPPSQQDHCSVWLPRGLRRVDIGGAPSGVACCCGASHGWLVLVDDIQAPTRLVLWEPLSNTEIPLPPPPLRVLRVFLSGDPLASSDWLAIASLSSVYEWANQKVYFWRPGETGWTILIDRNYPRIKCVTFYGGKIYFVNHDHKITVLDLNLGGNPIYSHFPYLVSSLCKCRNYHSPRGAFLVTFNNDLLLVALRMERGHKSFADVVKVEWTPQNKLIIKERISSLGEHALFVGYGDSFVLSSTEFPSIKRNHVYYLANDNNLLDFRKLKHWVFVFDLESRLLEEIAYPAEFQNRKQGYLWAPNSWFCPKGPCKGLHVN